MLVTVRPDGRVEMTYDDRINYPRLGCPRIRRASYVEPIPDGPLAGRWSVDFSPLRPTTQFCLRETFVKRQDALTAEVAALETLQELTS